jgi:hypothetical protein
MGSPSTLVVLKTVAAIPWFFDHYSSRNLGGEWRNILAVSVLGEIKR